MFALADCNNFFASCERVFRPELRNRPVIVLSNNDGCAIARSNEAKALGIKMGDPYFKIKDIIEKNDVAVFSGNMALYGDMSQRVRWVLESFAPSIEVYSIDEAFLDLRGLAIEDLDSYAKLISSECYRLTSIPVSVGIAPTKTLAKIASKLCKQYPKLRGGCYMHRPQDIEKVLRKFPIEDVWGIGRKSKVKLHSRFIKTAWDFTQLPQSTVYGIMGINGVRTWRELRGESCIEFEHGIEAKQSICVSRSFAKEIYDREMLCEQVANFASSAAEQLREQNSLCGEMLVFAFTNRFKASEPQTHSSQLVCFPIECDDHRSIVAAAVQATRELHRAGYGYKKAGVVMSKLIQAGTGTGSIFADKDEQEKEQRLSTTMDAIRSSFGRDALRLAAQGDGHIRMLKEKQSPHYTTLWSDLPKVSVK